MFTQCLRSVCAESNKFTQGLRKVCARFAQVLRGKGFVCARFTQGLRKVCAEGVWFALARKPAQTEFAQSLRRVCAEGNLLMLASTSPPGGVFGRKSARPTAGRRYGRLTSQGTPCGMQGGLKLTSVDIKLDRTTRAASSRQLP